MDAKSSEMSVTKHFDTVPPIDRHIEDDQHGDRSQPPVTDPLPALENSRSPLEMVSSELWIMILENLSKSTLRVVTMTCKYFKSLAVQTLYHTIDVSTHNLVLDRRLQNFERKALCITQYLFLKQILAKPEYGTHVRSFTWTMCMQLYYQLPEILYGKRVSWKVEEMYQMFSHLSQVIYLDISGGTRNTDPCLQLPPLFSSARHIKLGGKMHYAFATAILHGQDKSNLSSLSLYNLQESGLLVSGKNFDFEDPCPSDASRLSELTNFEEIWPENSLPTQVVPSCMRRLLPGLKPRCKHLNYLCLVKQAQVAPGTVAPGPLTHDEEVYLEWAFFLTEVHPKSLLIGHGSPYTPPPEPGQRRRALPPQPPPPKIRPMDENFRKFLLPVLAKSWRKLIRLDVKGMGPSADSGLGHLAANGVKLSIDANLVELRNAHVSSNHWSVI